MTSSSHHLLDDPDEPFEPRSNMSGAIHHIHLESFPELPMISWFNFVRRPRIKWPHGVMPESFAESDTEKVEGTEGLYRRPQKRRVAVKPAKKAAPMKPPKKGKGGKKKDC